MRISCEVIRDLLPLYVEDIASKDTQMLIEKHLESCPDCVKEMEDMRNQPKNNLPMDTYTKPLKKLKNTLFKKKLQTIALTVMLTLTIATIVIANLTTPDYIPYSEDVVSITEKNDGTVLVEFREDVSGYDLNRYEAEDKSGYEYHLTTWNSYWSRNIVKNRVQNTVLNPDGNKVSAVYYYRTDGSDSILIYGWNQDPGGGTILLPRLVLGYYIAFALVLFILSALLLLVFHRKKKARYWLVRITAIPACYIIGHFCVKGAYTPTYTSLRDFTVILTVAIPLYIVFLLALALINYYKGKTGKV